MGYDRILLAVGPDDRDSLDSLVDATVELADPATSVVHLLYVFPRADYEAVVEEMGLDSTTGGLGADEVAERHESVREPVNRLETLGIDYEINGVSGGNLADHVVRRVEQKDAGVVVIGGTRRSPAGKAMFGDRAQQILLNAPVPVLFVKRE
jgi:nucleotide-binding universal stress UspA family protein